MSALTAPQYYANTQGSAPTLTNATGSLVGILDAILVKGFPTQSITTLTHSAGVISANKTAHGYSVNDIISVSGAVEDEYNGRVTVATVPDADNFTYAPAVSNPASSPATGTILASTASGKAAAGWQLAYTGTNTRSYRARFGARMSLGVDDSALAYNTRVRGFETMTAAGVAVGSGTGPFPTDAQVSGGLFAQKTDNTAGTRAWQAYADDRTLYMSCDVNNGGQHNQWGFGDFVSYKSGDAYNAFICGKTSSVTSAAGNQLGILTSGFDATVAGWYVPRPYSQAGSSQVVGCKGDLARASQPFNGYGATPNSDVQAWPSTIDGSVHLARLMLQEPSGIRGHFRGMWQCCHIWTTMNGAGVAYYDTFAGSGSISSRTFRLHPVYYAGSVIWGVVPFEYSDTWD